MNRKIGLKLIQRVYKQRNWWDLILNLKIAKYLTYFIANYTKLTPNQITFISFIFAILSGIAFFYGYFIFGAILFQISYIFDIVDGALARVKNQTSKFGAFFDVFTDWLKAPVLIIELLILLHKEYFLICVLFLMFLNSLINKYNDVLFFTGSKSISKQLEKTPTSLIGRFFKFMKDKNIQPLPSTIEFEALMLFFYPIFQKNIFLYLAIFILSFQFLLKFVLVLKKLKDD